MENNKLWRYYDIVRFLTLVNGDIYFARADKFVDKYEGAIPKQNYIRFVEWAGYESDDEEKDKIRLEFHKKFVDERKKKVALSCWHLNERESAAMWEIYSKAGQGIAVRTSVDKLSKLKEPDGFELEMFKVDYIDLETEYSDEYYYNELLPFKKKRIEFKHESEFRIMLFQYDQDAFPFKDSKFDLHNPMSDAEIVKYGFVSKYKDIPTEGIKVTVSVSEIIDEIIASPHMKEYEVEEIQRVLSLINKDKGTSFTIRRSSLYDILKY